MFRSLLPAGPAVLPVLLLTLFACTKEPAPEKEEAVETGHAICFSEDLTKAGNSFEEGDCFYVWAQAEDGTMLMNSQEVRLTKDGWTYSPVKFWPSGQRITFWAVTPDPMVFSRPDPTEEWLLYEEPVSTVETMTAGPVTLDETNTVHLPFRHILTRVSLRARMDRSAPKGKSARIRSIKVSDVPAFRLFRYDGVWKDDWSTTTTVTLDLDRVIKGTDYTPIGDYYFIPAKSAMMVQFQILWDIIYDDTGETAEERISYSTQDESFLRQNNSVSFTLGLDGRIGLIEFEDPETKRLCVNSFDRDGDGEISYTEAAGVTDLGFAFRNSGITRFNELQYFTSLTSLGYFAFQGCNRLEAITFPSALKQVLEYAFAGCSSLGTVSLPSGVTEIRSGAFLDCSGLTDLDLTELNCSFGEGVFERSGLQHISLPISLSEIPDNTFYDCTALSSLSWTRTPTRIGKKAFCNCTSLSAWTFTRTTDFDDEAFSGSGLVSIDLSATSSAHFGSGVFANCKALNWIAFGQNFSDIPELMFRGCDRLIDLELPSQLATVGYGAFMDCSRIRELDIPATVTDIGAEAFAGCSRVVTVSSRAKKAPNTYNSSFGTSTLDYTGNQADGTRKLRVLTVSSGYGSGGWKVLVSSAGFKKTSVTRF